MVSFCIRIREIDKIWFLVFVFNLVIWRGGGRCILVIIILRRNEEKERVKRERNICYIKIKMKSRVRGRNDLFLLGLGTFFSIGVILFGI